MNQLQVYRAQEGFALRLESRLKNAELIRAREKLGLKAREAAEAIGIKYGTLLDYESMRSYPPPKTQNKICDFYRKRGAFLYEEDVFPEFLEQLRPKVKFVHVARIPEDKLIALSADLENRLLTEGNPAQELMENELLDEGARRLYEAIAILPEIDQLVLKSRYFEGKKYREIAKKLGLKAGETVKQIEIHALDKLRNRLVRIDALESLQYLHEMEKMPGMDEYIRNKERKNRIRKEMSDIVNRYFISHEREVLSRRFGLSYYDRRQSIRCIAKVMNMDESECEELIDNALNVLKEKVKEELGENHLKYLEGRAK